MADREIVPVLLGADLNCYNVARAFHMKYGVCSEAFGRYAVSATKYSRIVNFHAVKDIDSDEVMLKQLTGLAEARRGSKLVLFGCTDDYAAMIIRNKEALKDYITPYPSIGILDSISKKAEFYEFCEKKGIPYPATVVISEKAEAGDLQPDRLGFGYPLIIKPSSSVIYWKHPFDGMKKVYVAKDPGDAERIISEIYSSGYDDRIIIQEFIAGGDSQMRVLTTFSDKKGRVRAMWLGHTMLEEHTPKGLGNHAAIIVEPVSDLPVAGKIREMLEESGYTGFANFDIKLRKGTKDDFRVFEINLRQGRSNFYLTSSGLNVAELACEVYESEGSDCRMSSENFFWHHIPKSVAYTYTEDRKLVELAKKLDRDGKSSSSLWYKPDLISPLRFACVSEQMRRQNEKYKKYYPKTDSED